MLLHIGGGISSLEACSDSSTFKIAVEIILIISLFLGGLRSDTLFTCGEAYRSRRAFDSFVVRRHFITRGFVAQARACDFLRKS